MLILTMCAPLRLKRSAPASLKKSLNAAYSVEVLEPKGLCQGGVYEGRQNLVQGR